jgi:hypothetical protein
MNIHTSVNLTVTPDPDYRFMINAAEDGYDIVYHEVDTARSEVISFASAEEMEAVAKAMLQAVAAHRSLQKMNVSIRSNNISE